MAAVAWRSPPCGVVGTSLIVDDYAPTADVLAALSAEGGVTALVARDALEALQVIGRQGQDLVLTAVCMSRFSGVELYVHSKGDEDRARIGIALMSGTEANLSSIRHLAERWVLGPHPTVSGIDGDSAQSFEHFLRPRLPRHCLEAVREVLIAFDSCCSIVLKVAQMLVNALGRSQVIHRSDSFSHSF